MSKQTEDELDTIANDNMTNRLWGRSDTTSLDEVDVLLLFWRIIPQEQRPDSPDNVRGFLGEHPDLVDLLRNAWKSDKSYKGIRRHPAYVQAFPPSNPIPQQARPSVYRTEMVRSWAHPYTGNAPDALWKHITGHLLDRYREPYAPYCAIVQSSGTGKSRCIDEFSKTHFVIPINLKNPRSGGFPAADEPLYDFFQYELAHSPKDLYALMPAFLCALFEEVEKVIAKHASNSEDLPSWFRQYMTEGQTFESQGQNRKSLYEAVAERTRSLYIDRDDRIDYFRAASKLLGHFKPDEPYGSIHPFVILAFDEAHTLTSDVQEAENLDVPGSFSPLSHLRQNLRSLRNFHFRIFSVFLSTTGKITQFSDGIYRPTKFDRSTRVRSGRMSLIPAFTTLGWDNLAPPLPANAISEGVSCKDIGFGYQVFLGRPLFGTLYLSMLETRKLRKSSLDASNEYDVFSTFMWFVGERLTGCTGIAELTPAAKFAVLSQRFPLEFKVYSDAEREQVERHLRVCVSIDKPFVSMVTTNSSEPVLSEAACFFMRQADFNAPDTLLEVMRGFSIDKGDCGELIVLLLLTLARDQAAGASSFLDHEGFFGVVPFLKALFACPAKESSADMEDVLETRPSVYRAEHEKNISLKDAFENTFMHFNHFVKRGEEDGLDFAYILGFLARNAAVMCSKSQPGINGAIPMVSGTMILRTKTGLFLFRVKNDDDGYSASPDVKLYATMDPRSFGFEDLDVPVIRVVFSLGGRRPALRVLPQSSEPGAFTSYDIWASGLSEQVFCACKDNACVWQELLAASYGWKDLYTEEEGLKRELQMQTTPMAGNDDACWQWIGPDWKDLF